MRKIFAGTVAAFVVYLVMLGTVGQAVAAEVETVRGMSEGVSVETLWEPVAPYVSSEPAPEPEPEPEPVVVEPVVPAWVPGGMPACETEDSVGCYWDASERGNGVGRSFWTDADETIHYVD